MKFVSIIVCHYGQVDAFGGIRSAELSRSAMMKQSLESLFKNTDYPAEIIVMDNGGNPDDSEWFLERQREGFIDTYVRFKENMNFAFAWNQGFRLATGDYICFTCNDIEYGKGWLETCISLLEKYNDRKLLATPLITPDKDRSNFNKEILEDARINSLAGSNCFIIRPGDFKAIGEIPHHRVGGSIWHRRMHQKGYMVIAPPKNMANHLASKGGTNYKIHVEIERTLLKGEKINYTYDYNGYKQMYNGFQKDAGVKL